MIQGRNIVITGASSGLGEALKNIFLQQGDRVVSLQRTNVEGGIVCDISKEEDVKNAFLKIKKDLGSIDILINNSGYGVFSKLKNLSCLEFEREYQVNLFGAFYTYKYARELMKKGGKIINISSVCAFFPLPFRSVYCSSKAALNNLTFSLSMEEKDIQLTSICPGEISTNFNKNRVVVEDKSLKKQIEELNKDKKKMSREKVAKKIFKISKRKKIKPLYIIGTKYKFLYFLQKILPQKLFLNMTQKIFGINGGENGR